MQQLRVQIRNKFALQPFDHVLEHEFTFLEPFEHNVIDIRIVGQVGYYVVEIAVFDAQIA